MNKIKNIVKSVSAFGIEALEHQSRLRANDRRLPDEYREQNAEIADSLAQLRNYLMPELTDDNDSYDEDFENEITIMENSVYSKNSQINLKKREQLRDLQIEKSLSNEYLEGKALEEWDKKWEYMGKLSDAESFKIDENLIGIIKLELSNEIVYISRVIDLHNGGIREALSRLNSNNNCKNKLYQDIKENSPNISTYILVVGNSPDNINTCRNLENKFLTYYKPKWM